MAVITLDFMFPLAGLVCAFSTFVVVVGFWLAVFSGPALFAAQTVLFGWHRLWHREDRLGVFALARTQLFETLAWLTLAAWHLNWFVERSSGTRDPVLAIHGYTQNATNWTGLRRKLNARGVRCDAVFLGFPWPWRRIEGYAAPLERALEQRRESGERIDVVAHSMGGLVLREVLQRRPDLLGTIRRVVTLGTPHRGTAASLRLFRPTGQLRSGSLWVTSLPSLTELLPPERITTIGSRADLIVYPEATTRQPTAAHLTFDDVGHAALLTDGRVLEAAVDALTSAGA